MHLIKFKSTWRGQHTKYDSAADATADQSASWASCYKRRNERVIQRLRQKNEVIIQSVPSFFCHATNESIIQETIESIYSLKTTKVHKTSYKKRSLPDIKLSWFGSTAVAGYQLTAISQKSMCVPCKQVFLRWKPLVFS